MLRCILTLIQEKGQNCFSILKNVHCVGSSFNGPCDSVKVAVHLSVGACPDGSVSFP